MKSYKDIQGDGGSGIAGQVADHAARLADRMSTVKHILAVMSGKGGVGKSSVTVNLGAALAEAGHRVGMLDADVNGPSLKRMAGGAGARLQYTESGVQPAIGLHGIKFMSMELFLADETAPLLWSAPSQQDGYQWRGMMEMAALREFLTDTIWGELDYLLIDLPPGSDKLPHLSGLLPQLTGAIVVTLPTAVSKMIVSKSIVLAKESLSAPLIGLVENMTAQVCPHCGKPADLFPDTDAGVAGDVALLGRIPFDPQIAAAGDAGQSFLELHPRTAAAGAIRDIAAAVVESVDKNRNGDPE